MKNKIKIIIASAISVVGIIGVLTVFTSNAIFPSFPYKFDAISTKIKNANVNNQSIENYLAIDKDSKLAELEKLSKQAKENSEKADSGIKDFSVPTGLDYGSMLIFVEQLTLKNSLQVLNIDFQQLNTNNEPVIPSANNNENTNSNNNENTNSTDGQENKPADSNNQNNQNTQEQTPTQQQTPIQPTNTYKTIGYFNPSVVTVKVMGPYAHIQTYLEQLPKELGPFNYIDNLKIWKSKGDLAKEGVNANDQYLFDDEKDIIAEFDIVVYSKN